MKSLISVEDEWQQFYKACLPHVSTDSIQYIESKKVFISAMAQTLVVIRDVLGSPEITEMEGAIALENVYNQCLDSFNEMVLEKNKPSTLQ